MRRLSRRLSLERLEVRDCPAVAFPADANVINVATQFGANPNDGLDDTVAVQRALNTHMGSDRILYFPDGVYNFSARWTMARPIASRRRIPGAITAASAVCGFRVSRGRGRFSAGATISPCSTS